MKRYLNYNEVQTNLHCIGEKAMAESVNKGVLPVLNHLGFEITSVHDVNEYASKPLCEVLAIFRSKADEYLRAKYKDDFTKAEKEETFDLLENNIKARIDKIENGIYDVVEFAGWYFDRKDTLDEKFCYLKDGKVFFDEQGYRMSKMQILDGDRLEFVDKLQSIADNLNTLLDGVNINEKVFGMLFGFEGGKMIVSRSLTLEGIDNIKQNTNNKNK